MKTVDWSREIENRITSDSHCEDAYMDGAAGVPAVRRIGGTLAWMQVMESSREQRPRATHMSMDGR